jgi:hypothetical protein
MRGFRRWSSIVCSLWVMTSCNRTGWCRPNASDSYVIQDTSHTNWLAFRDFFRSFQANYRTIRRTGHGHFDYNSSFTSYPTIRCHLVPTTCHEGPEVEQRHSYCFSLTSALDYCRGQRHAPAVLPPAITRYPCYRGWVGRPRRENLIPTEIRSRIGSYTQFFKTTVFTVSPKTEK